MAASGMQCYAAMLAKPALPMPHYSCSVLLAINVAIADEVSGAKPRGKLPKCKSPKARS